VQIAKCKLKQRATLLQFAIPILQFAIETPEPRTLNPVPPHDYPYASPPNARTWQPPWPPSKGGAVPMAGIVPPLTLIVAGVMATASFANATMGPVARIMEPGPGFAPGLAYLCLVIGSIVGQAALLSVFAVWGGGKVWQRLAWHWALALVAFSAWTFGFMAAMASNFRSPADYPDDELFAALVGLPLVALSLQALPLVFRVYLHWRIECRYDETAASARPLSIRDLLAWTVLVAVTAALVRSGKPGNLSEAMYWNIWGIVSTVAVSVSLLFTLPMVYLSLGTRRAGWGVVGVVAIAAAAATIASLILMAFGPYGPGPSDKEIILMTTSIAAGFTLTLAGTLWIARRYGYRLETGQPITSPFGPLADEARAP
jgi:hypothetical protein